MQKVAVIQKCRQRVLLDLTLCPASNLEIVFCLCLRSELRVVLEYCGLLLTLTHKHLLGLKGHLTLFLKNSGKIAKSKFTNITSLQFLQLIRLRKSKRRS